MRQNERGLLISNDSDEAVQLFDRAVEHCLNSYIDMKSLVAVRSPLGGSNAQCDLCGRLKVMS
jgi:hypothetical protein